MCFRRLLFCLLWVPLSLSAQQEDHSTISIYYGPGRATARLARTDIDADLGDLGGEAIRDRPVTGMPGRSGGLDLRLNTNGRVVASASADYFHHASAREYVYGSSPGASGRLPVSFVARNSFFSLTGTLGLHYRLTPPGSKLDAHLGGQYHYTFYWHNYATYLSYQQVGQTLVLNQEERVSIDSQRQGASVSARLAYPVFSVIGLCADARYGVEAEQGTFDQLWMLRAGIVVYLGNRYGR